MDERGEAYIPIPRGAGTVTAKDRKLMTWAFVASWPAMPAMLTVYAFTGWPLALMVGGIASGYVTGVMHQELARLERGGPA